jgi:hypothetical protein
MKQIRTDFPFKVKEIENLFLPLSSGIKLSARMWMPESDHQTHRFPAILEYLPYRKNIMGILEVGLLSLVNFV